MYSIKPNELFSGSVCDHNAAFLHLTRRQLSEKHYLFWNCARFTKTFAKSLTKNCQWQLVMELLIYRLIRVPVISVRCLWLIKDVLCYFVWFIKKYQMYIYCIHLFRTLFIIPSHYYWQFFAKPLVKEFRKTSNEVVRK